MTKSPTESEVASFLMRVMEIEEKYAFAKKGQDSARKDELRNLLDELCN